MNTAFRKSVLVGIAGLSVAGTAAGCAPAAQAPAAQGAPRASESAAGTGSYKDGTYSADGNYISPNGTETVGVELTLAGGAVSDVKITQHPSNPNTRKFQGEFAGGIQSQIVGKKLDEIKVSKVAGSSLTSGGFNQAVEKIKSQAQLAQVATASSSRGIVPHPGWTDFSFDGIGTRWEISTPSPLSGGHRRRLLDTVAGVRRRVVPFPAGLAHRGRRPAARDALSCPPEAAALGQLYETLYRLTGGAMTPLIGGSLEHLGYDAAYSLRPGGPPLPAPPWDDVLDWQGTVLTTRAPVVIDVGAAGKGQLADLLSGRAARRRRRGALHRCQR